MAGYSTVEFHILYSETPHAHRFTAKLLACAEHQLELLQWFSLLHGLTLCSWILLKIYQQFLNFLIWLVDPCTAGRQDWLSACEILNLGGFSL